MKERFASLSIKAKRFNFSYSLVQVKSEKRKEREPRWKNVTFSSEILKLETVSKH